MLDGRADVAYDDITVTPSRSKPVTFGAPETGSGILFRAAAHHP